MRGDCTRSTKNPNNRKNSQKKYIQDKVLRDFKKHSVSPSILDAQNKNEQNRISIKESKKKELQSGRDQNDKYIHRRHNQTRSNEKRSNQEGERSREYIHKRLEERRLNHNKSKEGQFNPVKSQESRKKDINNRLRTPPLYKDTKYNPVSIQKICNNDQVNELRPLEKSSRTIVYINQSNDFELSHEAVHKNNYTLDIKCPICQTCKKVEIPKSIVESSQNIIKFSIRNDTICKHHFDVYINKNLDNQEYKEEVKENQISESNIDNQVLKTIISAKAILKIVSHSLKHANETIPRNKWVEVIGLLSGKLVDDEKTLLIEDAYPMSYGNAIYAEINDQNNYVKAWKDIRKNNEFIVGWYHSHPSYSCFMSEEDFRTQARYQKLSNTSVALVIDPCEIDGNKFGFEIFRADLHKKIWHTIPFDVEGHLDAKMIKEILNFKSLIQKIGSISSIDKLELREFRDF